jgi:hypothetical protein
VLELAQGDRAMLASRQWALASDEMSQGIRLRDSALDQYAKAAIQDLGGLLSLSQLDTGKLEWKRKEFVELYQSYLKSGVKLLPEARSQPKSQKFEGMAQPVRAFPSADKEAYVIAEMAKLGVKVEIQA